MNLSSLKLSDVRKELSRKSFWEYTKTLAPSFYKEDREYLKTFCHDLQEFYHGDDEVLIVNMPPRHGKSRTVGLFAQWLFGVNNQLKIMTGSYNETLSTTFSKSVRNTIAEEKADEDKIIYSDIFPDTKIKRGDAAANLWGLEGGHYNYLATSPTGTATGFGCNVMIIDDVIKNAEEAYNENTLEKHWDWFTNTMLSRLEEGGKIIIVMTRWASKDLAGRALEHFKEEGKKLKHVTLKALQDNGKMLCDEVLSRKSYDSKVRAMGEDIASANYQQVPIDVKGVLYKSLKTYDKLPEFERVISYTDTADQGNDYLCSVVAGIHKGEGYILDVYYTKEGMEVTEPETADFFVRNNVNKALIESNNGGRGFSRNVKRIIYEKYQTNSVVIRWFHQNKNKMARILTNSSFIQEHIYFPEDWRYRWPEFYKDIIAFQKEGKNKHDDAPDTLTGIAEAINKQNAVQVLR